jgi:O-6-methylguanine DNA methyltransferase
MTDTSLGTPAAWLVVPGPWGPIHLAASDAGLVGLELMTPTEAFVTALCSRMRSPVQSAAATPERSPARDLLDRAAIALAAFLTGERAGLEGLPIDLRTGTAWDRRVLEAVREIPFGEVTSYGRLARRIGAPGAARAVGGAVGRNPIGLAIPCHRVIAGDGTLGGYGGDRWGSREQRLAVKRDLLAREGVLLPA